MEVRKGPQHHERSGEAAADQGVLCEFVPGLSDLSYAWGEYRDEYDLTSSRVVAGECWHSIRYCGVQRIFHMVSADEETVDVLRA